MRSHPARDGEKSMTTKRTIGNHADIRILDDAELDVVNGGSVTDLVIDPFQGILSAMITSPRDPSSGLPTGKRMHGG